MPAAVRALTTVRLDRDVYHMGLRGTIDPEAQPEVAAAVLEARRAMRARLEDPSLGRLVEAFDPERYNSNATLAENLLFGAPVDETFDIDHLAAHPYVQQILDRAGLTDTLVEVGFKLAATMVELFADLPPDHEYFRQFSFISADDLPDYRALTTRVDPNRLDTLGREDRAASDRADRSSWRRRGIASIWSTRRCRRGCSRRAACSASTCRRSCAAASRSSMRNATRPRRACRTTSCSARSPTARRRRPSASAS